MRKHKLNIITSLMILLAFGLPAGTHIGHATVQNISAWVWPFDEHRDRATLLQGEQLYNGFGDEITVGDFNGDQAVDLLVSSPAHDTGGRVYLFSGPFSWGEELHVSDSDMTITAAGPSIYLGTELASGDLNGDGYDEIIMKAWAGLGDSLISIYPGQQEIGAGEPISYTLRSNPPIWTIRGRVISDLLTCDINSDGYEDLFLALWRFNYELELQVFGLLGSPSALQAPRNIELPGEVDIEIDGFDLNLGYAISSDHLGCGDTDGDAVKDLAIGVGWDNPNNLTYAGSIYIIQGRKSFNVDQPTHLTVPWDAGVILQGSDGCCPEGDRLGREIKVADFNSDGIADIVAAAPFGDGLDNQYFDAGEIYTWFGRHPDGRTEKINSREDLIANQAAGVIYSETQDLGFGSQMTSGDFNGDGVQDLLLGCRNCRGDPLSSDEHGMVFVIESPGAIQGWRALKPTIDWIGVQSLSRGGLGGTIAAADLDGDGIDDLILAAPTGSDPLEDSPGIIYLLPYPSRYHSWLPFLGR